MNFTEREDHVFAYFLAHEARSFSIDGRFARRVDFIKMLNDRLNSAMQTFGTQFEGDYSNVAAQLIDLLIEQGALLTSVDKYSGPLHQFDTPKYKTVIADLKSSNAILNRDGGADAINWKTEFSKFAG